MNTTKSIFLAITIILFALGAWPISLITLVLAITIPKEPKSKKTIEELEIENEALRAELADQAVRRAMERAEKREKE